MDAELELTSTGAPAASWLPHEVWVLVTVSLVIAVLRCGLRADRHRLAARRGGLAALA
ncbi:MAG: hypothetical protein ACRDQU_15420 [Pseudonocardiaceae bacterium]